MNLYVFNADESSLDPEYADSFSWLKKKISFELQIEQFWPTKSMEVMGSKDFEWISISNSLIRQLL